MRTCGALWDWIGVYRNILFCPIEGVSPNPILSYNILSTLLLSLTKKTTTHPCNGLFIRTLPQLGTPLSAESSAELCGGLRTSTQTFGKDRKKNSKCKTKRAKLEL